MLNRVEEVRLVKELGEKIGYGNMMDIASSIWAISLKEDHNLPISGAFIPAVTFMLKEEERDRVEKERDIKIESIKNYLKRISR